MTSVTIYLFSMPGLGHLLFHTPKLQSGSTWYVGLDNVTTWRRNIRVGQWPRHIARGPFPVEGPFSGVPCLRWGPCAKQSSQSWTAAGRLDLTEDACRPDHRSDHNHHHHLDHCDGPLKEHLTGIKIQYQSRDYITISALISWQHSPRYSPRYCVYTRPDIAFSDIVSPRHDIVSFSPISDPILVISAPI